MHDDTRGITFWDDFGDCKGFDNIFGGIFLLMDIVTFYDQELNQDLFLLLLYISNY